MFTELLNLPGMFTSTVKMPGDGHPPRVGKFTETVEIDGAEPWQVVFRHGLAPQFATAALAELHRLLTTRDPRVCWAATTLPPPLRAAGAWPGVGVADEVEYANGTLPVHAGCPVVVAAGGLGATVAGARRRWCHVTYEANRRLRGRPRVAGPGGHLVAPQAWLFYEWWDTPPHDEKSQALRAEVGAVLAGRGLAMSPGPAARAAGRG